MVYSTCIARVFFNIRESRIRGVFRSLNCGEIERVDMIKKVGRDKKNFWCVFIHWKNLSQEVRTALDKGEAVTIVYDEPWYWKMTKSNSPMPVRRAPPKMTIGGGSVPTTPPSSPTSGWVDAGDAMKTPPRSTNPTPTTPPSPPKLNRQRSCKVDAVAESIDHDPALQPDEELRGSATAAKEE